MTEADLAALMAADAARIRKDPRHAVNRGNWGIRQPEVGRHQREEHTCVIERTRRILKIIQHNPGLSPSTITEKLGGDVAFSLVKNSLARLRAQGKVYSTGPGGGHRYYAGPRQEAAE